MFDTSGADNKARVDEARKLITIIKESDVARYSQRESDFIHQTEYRPESFGDAAIVTPKQLFWLRDIKDRSI